MSACVLERELRTYRSKKQELVSTALNKYVLISGDEVISTWDTYSDALRAGYSQFGVDEPFMVQQVKDADTVHVVYRGASSAC